MQKIENKFSIHLILVPFLGLTLFAQSVWALPIDWHGFFGVDSTMINAWRRSGLPPVTNLAVDNNTGSQSLPITNSDDKEATWQSYLLRLRPEIVINDSVSFNGELTTGYGGGGFLGDQSATQQTVGSFTLGNSRTNANALYMQNHSDGAPNVNISKFYLEIFSDTATFIVGRQPHHWGLGIIHNSGEKAWDRFSSTRDGVTAKFKINNFHITPHWAKINSLNNLASSTNTTDYGVSFLYDNVERDLEFGILFNKRKTKSLDTFQNGSLQSGAAGVRNLLGTADVQLFDLYVKKTFGRFTFGLEVPFLKGELGAVYDNTINTKYKANAVVGETTYKFTERWSAMFNFGYVSGEDGSFNEFKALYLNANYHPGMLMLRYNLRAVTGAAPGARSTTSIWDSNVTNVKYLNLKGQFQIDNITSTLGVIWAQAIEFAKRFKPGFNHELNAHFTGADVADQDDEYGIEVNATFNYAWNTNLNLGIDAAYHFVGDYYEFTNTNSLQQKKDTWAVTGKVAVSF